MRLRRRACLVAALAPCWPTGAAWAGAQVEEPLADAVRGALAAAVADSAPPRPRFSDIDTRLGYLRWPQPSPTARRLVRASATSTRAWATCAGSAR